MVTGVGMRERLLARNVVLNLLGQGLPLVVALATMPFVIRGLGTERFGILGLAWVVLSYFTIFDLGLGRATTKFVAEALGVGEGQRVPAIVWNAVAVQAGLGAVGAFLLAGIAPVLVHRILTIPEGLVDEAESSFYVLAVAVPIVLVSSSFRGVLEAAHRFDLVNAVKAPLSAMVFFVPLVGVLLQWDLPGIIALLVLFQGAGLVAYYYLARWIIPSLKTLPHFRRGMLRTLVSYGGWVAVSNIVGPILVYLDRFMIGTVVTIAAVGYYTAPYEMVTRLWIVPASVVSALFPAFSTMSVSGGREALQALVTRSMKFLLFIVGPVIVFVVVFGRFILDIWLGPDFAEQSALALRILGIGILVNSLAQVLYSSIQAVGRPDLTAKFHLAELPVHVVVAWVLVTTWGITGAAAAWSIRVALDAVLLFVAAWRLRLVSPRSVFLERLPQTLVILVALASVGAGLSVVPPDGWLRVLVPFFFVLAAAGTTWRYLLDDHDRARLARLLRAAARNPEPSGQ